MAYQRDGNVAAFWTTPSLVREGDVLETVVIAVAVLVKCNARGGAGQCINAAQLVWTNMIFMGRGRRYEKTSTQRRG